MTRSALLAVCVALAATAFAQDSLRERSSRFRKLSSGGLADTTSANRDPINIRLQPTEDEPQQSPASVFANAPVQTAGQSASIPFSPQQPPSAVSPQPLRIPPVIAEILGIQNLGIPGLIETGPPGTNAGTGSAPAGVANDAANLFNPQVQGNPTWAELAQHNPELLKQLKADGIANSRVLSSIGQPPQPPTTSRDGGITSIISPQQRPFSSGGVPDGFTNFQQQSPFAAGPPPAGVDSTGFMNLLGSLAQRLTQASGVRDVLQQAGPAVRNALGPQQTQPRIGGADSGPPVAGLPKLPNGVALLPGGIPRDSSGQIDYVRLMSSVTQRLSNGTTLSDVIPPNKLQGLADNITESLLPETDDVDLTKFMGRWFEGINSPRATEQRCIVHHYGGLTDNQKTVTFTALKIYREGSEFGQVRYSIGYAFRGGHHNGMLQMHSSESADPAPFWIYKVGPEAPDSFGNKQYEYAIVSNWVRYPVTVLVRDPDTFKKKYEEQVLRYLENSGFINGFVRAFNMLQPSNYENCQYSESTFSQFGK